jgi:hypothetical protein
MAAATGRGPAVAVAAFLIGLGALMASRARNEDCWSGWSFGDAQTLLSVRHWQERGWLANRLLFVPQGYAPPVVLLDDPQLAHHAHGIAPGTSPVGPRLWYTHYPPGYLVPFALLARLGWPGAVPARMLSLAFSIAAVALMYLVYVHLIGRWPAAIAVAFYGASRGFLGYAHSLANQPLDDLLRFAFMLAAVLATRANAASARRRARIVAWMLQFVLSLCSFDSVFFAYAWLVGWDLLEHRTPRWRRWGLHALAPILAHGLQFAQNAWYLGAAGAWQDIAGTFLVKQDLSKPRLQAVVRGIAFLIDHMHRPSFMIDLLVLLYMAARLARWDSQASGVGGPWLLALLFACGASYAIVLPGPALMIYQGRQLAPFGAALAASVACQLAHTLARRPHSPACLAWLLVSGVTLGALAVQLAGGVARPGFHCTHAVAEADLARHLRSMPTRHEPMYFSHGGFTIFFNPSYTKGFPQILPLLEYYAGCRPILCFTDVHTLVRDLGVLLSRSAAPFSPVLVAADVDGLDLVLSELAEAGLVSGRPPVGRFGHRAIADLTDHLARRSR